MNAGPRSFPPRLQEEIANFFEYVPASRLSRSLRRMTLSYMAMQEDGQLIEIQELLNDLQALFDLLDVAADELPGKV